MKKMFFGLLIILFFIVALCFWMTQPLIFAPQVEIVGRIDPEKLRLHVEKISNAFYPRSERHLGNLNKTADYIKAEFERSGAEVSEQKFRVGGREFRNVIALFGAQSSERIVIGAHYDGCGDTYGADDNASGVAGLIELAQLLGRESLPLQVELVAYTLEEPPFFATTGMGSHVHAKSLKEQGINVRLMISLEMIGYFSDEPNSQEFPVSALKLLYPTKGNFISVVGNVTNVLTTRRVKSAMQSASDLPVYSVNVPQIIPGVDFSDHRNYWIFGYDAIMITDTAFYRNRNYHTTGDTAEKLDYGKMAKVADGVYKFVKTLN
jgi:Zn-dependent M28 family amino/carboxypeptidase